MSSGRSRSEFLRIASTVTAATMTGCSRAPTTASSPHVVESQIMITESPLIEGEVAATISKPKPTNSRQVVPSCIKPPRLRAGDAVGIIACGGPARTAHEIPRARENLERLGLVPVTAPHLADSFGYLAGSDAARAADFNAFARDSRIRGIIALRGGYGTMRILDLVDYDAIANDPKIIIGFSDVTALLNAVAARTGVTTFHGPVAGHGDFSANVANGLRVAAMTAEPIGRIRAREGSPLQIGGSSSARGRIFGGNLSIVAALCGTAFAVPSSGSIMLLEDVKEAPYRVDRMLTQLRLSGALESVSAVALGQFVDCIPNVGTDDTPSATIQETLRERLGDLRIPIITDLPFGHIPSQMTFPIGIRASVDSYAQTFTIEESAVS